MNDDATGPIVSVEPGDPRNDQMLAQAREDLHALIQITLHPAIEAAEAQNVDQAGLVAALVRGWLIDPRYMPRERMAPIMALALMYLAETERMVVRDGKSIRKDEADPKDVWIYEGRPCCDPQCGDSTWDHDCPTPPKGVIDD
jgi:hypothetical protein